MDIDIETTGMPARANSAWASISAFSKHRGAIEQLMTELARRYTIVIVTHNMQQAARVSDYTGFMYLGKLIECGKTGQIFEHPAEELTENYITGRYG